MHQQPAPLVSAQTPRRHLDQPLQDLFEAELQGRRLAGGERSRKQGRPTARSKGRCCCFLRVAVAVAVAVEDPHPVLRIQVHQFALLLKAPVVAIAAAASFLAFAAGRGGGGSVGVGVDGGRVTPTRKRLQATQMATWRNGTFVATGGGPNRRACGSSCGGNTLPGQEFSCQCTVQTSVHRFCHHHRRRRRCLTLESIYLLRCWWRRQGQWPRRWRLDAPRCFRLL
mmetsp:Transcript_67772/g.126959  ORF Transcript_67772/g.126959 Transcript_67772/m.126959 type:complete len:226 (-) Transcript_67772:26-703(-)